MPFDVSDSEVSKAASEGLWGLGSVVSVFVSDCSVCHYRTPEEKTWIKSARSLVAHLKMCHPEVLKNAQMERAESDEMEAQLA